MASNNLPIEPKSLIDATYHFEAGMNSGVAPPLLEKNQLSFATNATVRGTFVGPRPPLRKVTLDFSGGDSDMQTRIEKGLWQGACYFKPDAGTESLMAAISGHLYRFQIGTASIGVTDETIPGDPNPANKILAWLWQAEKWVIWMDGQSTAVFFDQTATPTSRRSNYGSRIAQPTTTGVTATWIVPAVGSSVTGVNLVDVTNLVVGDVVTVKVGTRGVGTFQVITITPGVPPAGTVDLLNLTGSPTGYTVATTAVFSWYHAGAELPPGRMGAYGMGRNWISLVDGKQFIASDLVGGSSGTIANNYRDAVLNVTENNYLYGGGNFTVPGSAGDIRAMIFASTLDVSLGQGPLQVFTPNVVFSCNAPVDRTTWQYLTNPILTESLISNGALGQNSTVAVNGDTLFRSIDGIRSLILGRRDFNSWGNVPISTEMSRVIDQDDRTLLFYSSAIVFDNRVLMTCSPVGSEGGVYHQGIIALNLDPISSLRGKAASVYDGLWLGINVLQLIKGQFGGVERAFAFTYNAIDQKIELYEILTAGTYDNDTIPITWAIETPIFLREQKGKTMFDLCRLLDGEISIGNLKGRALFQVFYRPDEYPCWIPWGDPWAVCAREPDPLDPATANYQAGYQPRIGFGEPDPKLCDTYTNRPFREGFYFQVRLVINGYCEVRAIKLRAVTIPQLQFAAPICGSTC